ncbi:MAG: DUF6491 family protein [Woeseiaceae bacterium]
MKIRILVALLATLFAVSTPAFAVSKSHAEFRRSDSIWLPRGNRLHNWRAVDHDELLIWASPSRAYLVKVWRPYSSLRFARYIGVTSTAGRITRFDRVIANGERLPIRSIVAIDREYARDLRWRKTGPRSSRRYYRSRRYH